MRLGHTIIIIVVMAMDVLADARRIVEMIDSDTGSSLAVKPAHHVDARRVTILEISGRSRDGMRVERGVIVVCGI